MKKINSRQLLSLIILIATLFTAVACAPATQTPAITSDNVSSPETDAPTEAPVTTEPPVETEDPNRKLTLFEEEKWAYRLVTRTQRSHEYDHGKGSPHSK